MNPESRSAVVQFVVMIVLFGTFILTLNIAKAYVARQKRTYKVLSVSTFAGNPPGFQVRVRSVWMWSKREYSLSCSACTRPMVGADMELVPSRESKFLLERRNKDGYIPDFYSIEKEKLVE
jgi:hypothetical protein